MLLCDDCATELYGDPQRYRWGTDRGRMGSSLDLGPSLEPH